MYTPYKQGRQSFGYYVSPEQRRREVVENEAVITRCDRVLALLPSLSVQPDAQGDEPEVLAARAPENAAAMDLSPTDLLGIALRCDWGSIPAWIDSAPEPGKDWYDVATRLVGELEQRYGRHVYPMDRTKKDRADAVRRLRTAKKALENA